MHKPDPAGQTTNLKTAVHVHVYIVHVRVCLKALCRAIRADFQLIEAARAHTVNEQWAWRMADEFTCTFKLAR
jgi:hypothetical protein